MEKNEIQEIQKKLSKYGQSHLLYGYDKLNEKGKNELINEIEQIDFNLINNLYNNTKKVKKAEEFDIEPINFLDKNKQY